LYGGAKGWGYARPPTKYRRLDSDEQKLADSVFRGSLGSFQEIYLSDGLEQDNTPFTLRSVHSLPAIFGGGSIVVAPGKYVMFVGSYCDTAMTSGYAARLLIHELVHVWQYAQGYSVVLNSLVHRALKGEGMYDYDTTNFKEWSSYNVEQQANIVEHWYETGMKRDDPRYRYIGKNIWSGLIPYEFDATRPDPPRPRHIATTDPLAELMKPRYASGDPASLN